MARRWCGGSVSRDDDWDEYDEYLQLRPSQSYLFFNSVPCASREQFSEGHINSSGIDVAKLKLK